MRPRRRLVVKNFLHFDKILTILLLHHPIITSIREHIHQTKGQHPDLTEPVVLSAIRKGTSVKALCQNVSSQMLRDFNFALVWGKSAKHSPQRCGVNHQLADEDVVQIVTKTNAQMRQDKNYQAIVQGFSDKVRL